MGDLEDIMRNDMADYKKLSKESAEKPKIKRKYVKFSYTFLDVAEYEDLYIKTYELLNNDKTDYRTIFSQK